nr:DNA-3-methyladenine glycosylase I [Skermanella stibiiresistens]
MVLRKREAFREAFPKFDPTKLAMFGADDVERLMANPDIIRAPSVPRSRQRSGAHRSSTPCRRRTTTLQPSAGHSRMGSSSGLGLQHGDRALSDDIEGAQEARLQVRRTDDRLCLDAGRRHR